MNLSNHGAQWSDEQDEWLLNAIKKLNIYRIAEKMERTPESIKRRLFKLAHILINKGANLEEVLNNTKIDPIEYQEYVEKYIFPIKKPTKKVIQKSDDICINDLNEYQKIAIEHVMNKKNVFITAPAGYGKSYLIKKIHQWAEINNIDCGITALSGTAAVLINGRTLHSFLGINLAQDTPERLYYKCKEKYKKTYNKLIALKILIIDEISMMDVELFNKIDDYLKLIKCSNKPFGGIQIILLGDFVQLPPVKGSYCFLSEKWNNIGLEIVQLKKNMRQNQEVFQQLLEKLRWGICSDQELSILQSLKNTKFEDGIMPTKIYSLNIDIDRINNQEFNKISQNNIVKTYKTTSTPCTLLKLAKSLNIHDEIKLCKGAQVILTTNLDFDKKLVNGSRGVCLDVLNDSVVVKFRNNNLEMIPFIKYYPDDDNNREYISYIPLKLGYAITCHRSQGMTLDAIEIDLGSKIFCDGQAYTAISRAQKLDNIKIINLDKDSFMTNELVKEFYKKLDV